MSHTPNRPVSELAAGRAAAPRRSTRTSRRRTPEAAAEVVEQIRRHGDVGATLRREEMLELDPALVRAGEAQFGLWRAAVRAAGLSTRRNERWSEARVVKEIRRLHRLGFGLTVSSVDRTLMEAAILHLGSWRRAIERAGLDYERVGVRQMPSREELLALITKRARMGHTGISEDGLLTPTEADHVRTIFGSVQDAIEEAGLDPSTLVRRKGYTRAHVATALRKLAAKQPDMTLKQLRILGVSKTAVKLFGDLDTALEAAGLTEWPVRRIFGRPRAEILAAVRKRYESGASMTTTDAIREDRPLVKGVYKHFGTWRAALKIAGVPYDDGDEPMTRAQVRAELRARRKRHEPMSVVAIQRDDPALWKAVIERYGGLVRAENDRRRKTRNELEPE